MTKIKWSGRVVASDSTRFPQGEILKFHDFDLNPTFRLKKWSNRCTGPQNLTPQRALARALGQGGEEARMPQGCD